MSSARCPYDTPPPPPRPPALLYNIQVGGLMDAFGRKRLMLVSPIAMVFTALSVAWRPTVSMLIFRQFLMPIASTPWHDGERACLADMFAGDGQGYASAKARISTLGQVFKPYPTALPVSAERAHVDAVIVLTKFVPGCHGRLPDGRCNACRTRPAAALASGCIYPPCPDHRRSQNAAGDLAAEGPEAAPMEEHQPAELW